MCNSCGNPRCLSHLRVRSASQYMSDAAKSEDQRARRKAAQAKRFAVFGKKISRADAMEIYNRTEPLHLIGKEFGISAEMASRIRRGIAWAPISSPFAGLGAR